MTIVLMIPYATGDRVRVCSTSIVSNLETDVRRPGGRSFKNFDFGVRIPWPSGQGALEV